MDDPTTDLSGENLAHGVMQPLTSALVDIQIMEYFHPVAPKLTIENPICNLDGSQDGHCIERFPECIFQVIQVEFLVIANKICSNLCIFDYLESLTPSSSFVFLFSSVILLTPIVFVAFSSFAIIVAIAPSIIPGTNEQLWPRIFSNDDVTEEVGLEEFLPENVGEFGDDQEETEHVGKPEVVVSNGSISSSLQGSLVNIATSSFTCSRKVKDRTFTIVQRLAL